MQQLIETLAGVATAVGVVFVWLQFRQANRQSQTNFEDDLAREYRELARHIPTEALLNKELSGSEQEKALPYLYQYVDLCNEQTFLRMVDRISEKTWTFWRDGLRTNLARPAFKAAWDRIKADCPNSFEELRLLESSNFKDDPRQWKESSLSQKQNEVN